MLFHRYFGSAYKLAVFLRTPYFHLIIMNSEVRLDICLSFPSVVTKFARKWFRLGVSVPDMICQGRGTSTRHVAMWALVVAYVYSHVIP